MRRRHRRHAGRLATILVGMTVVIGVVSTPSYATANPVTPGDFTGYGFDQCTAPGMQKMDHWLQSSPYLAVGIYISGASRGCRNQPHLTPTWVATELAAGWRLLPITLGPQASCNPSFPRYGNDPVISPRSGRHGRYSIARHQGTAEAKTSVAAALALGITPGSTLWYDLEGYDVTRTHCRDSSLYFLSAWTQQVHAMGFVSGVYSSAGSGMKALDDARVLRPGIFHLPDAIWIARWDGAANTTTTYLRADGWMPGGRMKQYLGGHNETWGHVTINVDRDYLNLGQGSVAVAESHCGGRPVDFATYPRLLPPSTGYTADPTLVTALKCLLKEDGAWTGRLTGTFTSKLLTAVHAWQTRLALPVRDVWSRRDWVSLVTAAPASPVVKRGSVGPAVRRLQRALEAADAHAALTVTGVFDTATDAALRAWQTKNHLKVSGVAGTDDWALLQAGHR